MRIRKLIWVAVGTAALLNAPLHAQETDPELMQKKLTFEGKLTKAVSANYLLYLPRDYDAKGKKKWPLILFLHGAGERGTDVSKVAMHGPPKRVKNKQDLEFIIVSPQCPSGQRWDNDVLLGLLDDVIAKHKVDVGRIYLTGLSMGGFGSWSLGLAYPERFAAIAPICGGGDPIMTLLPDTRKQAAMKSLPIWAFHGAQDTVVKLVESERMVDAAKRAGCKEVELTVYPETQHDSWTETYDNPKLYEWFLAHERKSAK